MTETPPGSPLSDTELAILQLIATGATNREIGRERSISEATVKKHVTNINAKLGTGNRTEAVRRALEMGLVTVEGPVQPDGVDRAAAKRLADELERTRRQTRRITRALVLTGVAGFIAAAAAVWLAIQLVDDPAVVVSEIATAIPPPGADWIPGRDLPSPRTDLVLVADEREIYAIGGADSSGVLADTLVYDEVQIGWRPRTDKPTAVQGASAVPISGSFLVAGGCLGDGSATDVVELYDPEEDVWTRGPTLPEPVCGFALVDLQGRVYLLGGRSGSDPATASDRVWRYDREGGEWTEAGRMPLARCDMAAVALGNQIHVLGGLDRSGRPQSSHWVYTPLDERDRWNTEGGPPLPEGRAGLVAVGLLRNIWVVGGGWDRTVENGALVWVAEPGKSWEPYATLRPPTPQRGHAITVVHDQWLHIAGGESDGRLLDQYQTIRPITTIMVPGPR